MTKKLKITIKFRVAKVTLGSVSRTIEVSELAGVVITLPSGIVLYDKHGVRLEVTV